MRGIREISMSRARYEDTLKEFFSDKEEVVCVYLFGSAAARKGNFYSDVDIAVLYDNSVVRSEYTDKQIDLSVELSRLLDRNVDIIILNNAGPYLKFQVIKSGIRVYEDQKRDNRTFEARSIVEYFDFLPVKNMLEASVIKNIRGA
ncbi:MAG: nucleotidyltransferase domain-containing protein [Candidatus Omnitrophota bacterium]|nr:nucleotidyltransferase domain-containing protein [Candidatus Omnitrophota bacterium]